MTNPHGFWVSYSESTDATRMTHFRMSKTATVKEIIPVITKFAWSPCVWTGGQRLKTKFRGSFFCVLDFDDGVWSVKDAIEFLEENNLAGIVGTTRSHQVEKNGKPAVDRFRLVIPWSGGIHCLKTYEQNMKQIIKGIGGSGGAADSACSDGARFFWPCTEVVYYRAGRKLAWKPYQEPKPNKRRQQALQRDKNARLVPSWMRKELENGIPEGTRNKTAFVFANRLKERGFTFNEAYDELSRYITLDETELTRTIRNAYK